MREKTKTLAPPMMERAYRKSFLSVIPSFDLYRLVAAFCDRSTLLKPQEQRDLVSLVLALVTLVIYWPVRHFDFVSYDDPGYVVQNRHVYTGLRLENIRWAWTTLHGGVSYWHPLTWLSHQLDCEVFGLMAGAHHLTSLVIHIANSVLLFRVLVQMTGKLGCSALVAGIFALHPVHVESVAWIAERKDVLSAFFWMLTVKAYVSYVERPRFGRYLTTLFFFVCGLMSKPMVVTLPFVLCLLDFWPLGRARFGARHARLVSRGVEKVPSDGLTWTHIAMEKAPFCALSLVSCVLTLVAQHQLGATAELSRLSISDRIGSALVSYFRYLAKTAWPSDLAVFYPRIGPWPIWQVTGAALVLASLTMIALRLRDRHPYLAVGWIWYLGTLVPVIGLVQVGAQSMADRYTYIPLIGVFIAVVWYLDDTFVQRSKMSWLPLVAVLFLALGLRTSVQLRYWRDGATLFEHTSRVTALNWVAHNNLGAKLLSRGKTSQAISHFLEAIRIAPADAYPLHNMGLALMKAGRIQEALSYHKRALRVGTNEPLAHLGFGLALLENGMSEEALAHLRKAVQLNSSSHVGHAALGRIWATHPDPKLRDARAAVLHSELACALTLYQNAECLNILAAAYAEASQFDNATSTAHRALDLAHARLDSELATNILLRLIHYREGKAYYDTRLAAPGANAATTAEEKNKQPRREKEATAQD